MPPRPPPGASPENKSPPPPGPCSFWVTTDAAPITSFTVTPAAPGAPVVITVNTNPEITERIENADANDKTVTVTYKTGPGGQNTFVSMVVH